MKCPEHHTKIATGYAGDRGTPGDGYHFVKVLISTYRDKFRVAVHEEWGSNQGYLEPHGETDIVTRGDTIAAACLEAETDGTQAEMSGKLLCLALNEAADNALLALEAARDIHESTKEE